MSSSHICHVVRVLLMAQATAAFLSASPLRADPVAPGVNQSNPITFDRLGAEAQKQYQGQGIGITPTAEGAVLRAEMQKLSGTVSGWGLELRSTESAGGTFKVQASALGRGKGPLPALPAYGVVAAGTGPVQAVSWARPGLVEDYSVSADGVRQDFVVLDRPAGVGALALELKVSGAVVEAASYGAKLTLPQSGRELAYSRLHVTDAVGRELTAEMKIKPNNMLCIEVEDRGAAYPVRIDPTFSDADWVVTSPGILGADSTVSCLAFDSANNLYVGGNFNVIGALPFSGLAKWDGSNWTAPGGQSHDLTVSCLVFMGTDLYAGGTFDEIGGVAAKNIAKWNGTVWSPLGAGITGGGATVLALVASGGNLYAGGYFNHAGDVAANSIAKWNGSDWSNLGSGVNGSVSALLMKDTDLYVGGYFSAAGGQGIDGIAKWNGSAWSALGTGIVGQPVLALALYGTDIYAGGQFQSAGGVPASRIARWNGSAWSAVGSGVDDTVMAMAVSGGELFVVGAFTQAGGISANCIAKWNGSAWSTLGTGADHTIYSLAISGSNIWIGGDFRHAGDGVAKNIARWDGATWNAIGIGLTSNEIQAIVVSGSTLYLGLGVTTTGGNVQDGHVAKWDGSTWSSLGSGVNGVVHAMAIAGGLLYVGGEFSSAGGIPANNIAKWDGSAWSALGNGITAPGIEDDGRVQALAVSGANLFVGGLFTKAGTVTTRSIAKWNGSAWSSIGSTGDDYDGIVSLAFSGEDLYAGGYFAKIGGVKAACIAKWNGSAWSALGDGVEGGVNCLAVMGTNVYVGGNFAKAGPLEDVGNIAMWNGNTWSRLGSGANNSPYALLVSGTDLYAAGNFDVAGGVNVNHIAKWDGLAWSALGSGLDAEASALAVSGSQLYVGGSFLKAGGKVSPCFAQANIIPSAPPISTISDTTTDEDTPTPPLAFTLSAGYFSLASVSLIGSSDNPDLVPDGNIVFGGSGGDRTITITPAPDKFGEAVITIYVGDAAGNNVGTSFLLTVSPVSESPIALDQADMGGENDLLHMALNAHDPDDDPLTYLLQSDPSHGSVILNDDGTYSYLPDDSFLGADSFTYLVNDGSSDSAVATVTLVIVRQPPRWAWMAGSNLTNQRGVYPATANNAGTPGARSDAASWSDGAGTLWVFGGLGQAASTGPGLLNDLWRCDLGTQTWTWLGGGKAIKTKGAYGAQGTANAANNPGARSGAATWRDGAGNLWLFGGSGLDSSATGNGPLNDLWKYNVVTNQWTWIKGSNLIKANGVYGSLGVADAANTPGARSYGAAWVDAMGNFWLFGGIGLPAAGATAGTLNDLWKYDPGANQWTWVKGAKTTKALGVYGSQGIATNSANPGARSDASAWVDRDGMLWLFGGNGNGGTSATGNLNDLWKYDPSANAWTWMRGATVPASLGSYGTLGLPAASNDPPARSGAAAWVDMEGALCIFGGMGTAERDDVWRYAPALNQWTWVKGSSAASAKPVFGAKGTGDPTNTPGARTEAVVALDAGGDPWLYGGSLGAAVYNDLWLIDLPALMKLRTLAATNVTTGNATLNGTVNPRGFTTTAKFRYSKRLDMTGAVEVLASAPGSGNADVPVQASISGLTAGSTYYFQVLAANPFGWRSGGMLSFVTGGSAPAVTAALASASSLVSENGGAAVITVELSGPAPSAFTLPISVDNASTAVAATDFAAPILPLSFVAGQMVGRIVIPVLNDLIPEPGKTLVLNLGTPTIGGVTLGAPATHTLALTDDDLPVVIGRPPQSQIVAMGSTTVFTVVAGGTPPLSYQWKKNGTKITGATSATYSIANTPLAAAASYSVDVSNALGSKPSASASLSVVDTTPEYFTQAVNSNVAFTVDTGGAGLDFQWKKGPNEITGAVSKTLSLTKLPTTAAGAYTCVVTKTGVGSLTSGVFTLQVPTLKPVITPVTTLTAGIVGGAYRHQILFNDDPLLAPKSFTVTGLPAGLKLDATTGLISGDCTAAVSKKAITITATNNAGTSTKVNCTLTILVLPPEVQGTWLGYFERRPGVGGNLGGRLDLTVTKSGDYTAKLLTNGAAISATGNLVVTLDDSGVDPVADTITGRVSFPRKGQSALDLNFTLGISNHLLSGFLLDPATREKAVVQGVHNKWSLNGPKASDFKGYYTFGLGLTSSDVGDIDRPQGGGFGSFTVADDGKLTCAGRTADGLTYTIAGFAGPGGQVVLYAPFAPAVGSLCGMGVITASSGSGFVNNTFSGTLTWSKGAAPKTSADQAYRLGFPPLFLEITGGKYKEPAAGGVIRGLTNADKKARISFSEGGLLPGDIAPLIFSIRNLKTTGVAQTVTVPHFKATPAPNPNPNKVAFALASSPLGQYSGSFVLSNPIAALARTAKYQGIVIWNGSAYSTAGHFLLPKLPEPGQTLTTSPVLSGPAILDGAL